MAVQLERFPGTDYVVEPCDADGVNIIGIADLAMASQTGRGSWRKYSCIDESLDSDENLPYITGDQVKVIWGDVIVMLILCESQTITAGEKLQCCGAVPGHVKEFTCETASPCALIAEAMEDKATGAGECKYIMAKLLI